MDAIARGLVLIIAVFLVVSMIVFALINLPAGDPAQTILGNQPWVEEARALNRGLDNDRPLAVRYFIWLGRVVQRLIQGSVRRERAMSPPREAGPWSYTIEA